ncbi:MAG: hypothetical protein WAN38_15500 [Terriglobales bacterium]|jgi:hypothetical protein
MDPRNIIEQIDRILRSRTFASKGQLKKLLEVLHRNMHSEIILTGDEVIEELWPSEIKTKRSADVATEMNRLRRALKSYYTVEGASDPIVVSLPNRAVTAGNDVHERPWIVAAPRATANGPSSASDHDHAADDDRPQATRTPTRTLILKIVALVAALCAVLGVAYLAFATLAAHPHPQTGRLDGSVLRIMAGDGKELWSKTFPDGFQNDWYYYQRGLETRLWFGDLEGKGHTSVLFSYMPAGTAMSRSSTLICYSDRGKEKWRWSPGRELPELAGSPGTYATWAIRVLKATEKNPARIVVLSQQQPWWPSQIALLDVNGKFISEYWHSGGLSYMVLADLDGNGREEIIATGISEYDHQATLVVLDPDRVFGASTEAQPQFQIHGMGVAQERMRLFFPRSDMNRALFQFNAAIDPSVEPTSIRLTVAECITPSLGCRIYYEFDKNFRLIAAFAGGDEFRSAHETFYQSGKNAHHLSAKEQAAFQKVRCLAGCSSEFVPAGPLVP